MRQNMRYVWRIGCWYRRSSSIIKEKDFFFHSCWLSCCYNKSLPWVELPSNSCWLILSKVTPISKTKSNHLFEVDFNKFWVDFGLLFEEKKMSFYQSSSHRHIANISCYIHIYCYNKDISVVSTISNFNINYILLFRSVF